MPLAYKVLSRYGDGHKVPSNTDTHINESTALTSADTLPQGGSKVGIGYLSIL